MREIGPFEIAWLWGFIWVFGWAFFGLLARHMRNKTNQRRLELIHQERMAAMEKGIPLPELPDLGSHWRGRPHQPDRLLLVGIVCISLGIGAMIALNLSPIEELKRLWTMPLPLVFLGAGQILYFFLTRDRTR